LTPSKATFLEAALLKAFSTAAWAKVVATKLLFQQLVSMHDACAAFDVSFGWESPPPLTHRLEKTVAR